MGNPAGAARRIRGEVDGVEMKRAAHAIPLAYAAHFAGPCRQTGRTGAMSAKSGQKRQMRSKVNLSAKRPLGFTTAVS
jgi:hypothetical protein